MRWLWWNATHGCSQHGDCWCWGPLDRRERRQESGRVQATVVLWQDWGLGCMGVMGCGRQNWNARKARAIETLRSWEQWEDCKVWSDLPVRKCPLAPRSTNMVWSCLHFSPPPTPYILSFLQVYVRVLDSELLEDRSCVFLLVHGNPSI